MRTTNKWVGAALSAALTAAVALPGAAFAQNGPAAAGRTFAAEPASRVQAQESAAQAANATVKPDRGSAGASDIAGHWAQDAIRKWQSDGIVNGYPDGTFRPGESMTRAEFVTLVNRLFGFAARSATAFDDVPDTAWYAQAMAVARQAGYYKGVPGNLAEPGDPISRQDAVVLLAGALQADSAAVSGSGEDPLEAYKDKDRIRPYAREAARALAASIAGYGDGAFHPEDPLSRAEAVSLLDKLIPARYTAAGEYEGGEIAGSVVVNHDGITLRDAVIAGNLYLAPGIGEGEAILDNVTVQGAVYVAGGGEHTVILSDSKLGAVRVDRKEGGVRVVAKGTTAIGELVADSPSTLEIGEGASIESARLNRPVSLSVAEGGSIASLLIGAEAGGTTVTGQGDIARAEIGASGVTVNGTAIEPGEIRVNGGSSAPWTGSGSGDVAAAGNGNANGNGNGSGSGGGGGSVTPPVDTTPTVNLADKDATARTRSLYVYLNGLRGSRILFGQQHATDEGLAGSYADGTRSDSYNDVGAYPALFGWDTLSLEGKEKPGVAGDFETSRDNLIASMKTAYENGGVLTLSSHLPNFVTGGDFYDTKGNVVSHILPGGDKNAAYNAFLDKIADFANRLKDDQGQAIPVIYRPFHEQNGSWFWWGAAFTTTDEYKEIYRYTVEYLRDKKGVRNFLYAFSPGGGFGDSASVYLKTYPGDDYVDILGFDSYYNGEGDSWFNGVVTEAKTLSRIADGKGKVAALTEFGYQRMKVSGNATTDFFTRLADALQSDPDAKRMAYMLTWANFGPDSYVPYHTGDPEREHEMLPDFIKFYEEPYTLFSDGVNGAYDKPAYAASEQGFMHIASPTDQSTVADGTTKIRVRVLNETPQRVVYTVGGSAAETPLVLDGDSGYYTADWTPPAAANGKTETITVSAYGADGTVLQTQTNTVFVKISEVPFGAYTFDNDIAGVQYNGEYSDSLLATNNGSVLHSDFGGGALRLNATKLSGADTWQEFKLELKTAKKLVGGDTLGDLRRVRMDVWVPASLGDANAAASLRAVLQLPPDWSAKYGMETTTASFASLPRETVDGVEYVKYSPTVDFPDEAALNAADDVALSLVGSGLDTGTGTAAIYIDNIRLLSTYAEATADPNLVDDFESYLGSDAALTAKLVHAGGDEATAALDGSRKHGGSYGMKYSYTLAGSGYSGVTKALSGVDWSGDNALQFWYEPDGKGQKLVMQINANGKTYEYYPDTTGTEPAFVTAPFNEFVGANGATGPLTKMLLKNVQAFSIYTNAVPAGTALSSSMYFDDIRALNDPDAGAVPAGSDGGGVPLGTLFGFEDGTAGWALNDNTLGASNLANSADGGSKALSADFPSAADSADRHFELAYMNDQDLSGGEALTLKARVSAGTAKAKLFLKYGDGWTWVSSDEVELSEEYRTISLALGDDIDKTLVKAIGLQVYSPTGEGTKTVYIDEVTLE